jgi:hypothetical protein
VRAVTSPELVTDPSVVGLVDLTALAGSETTASAVMARTKAALVLAHAVDARPEPLRGVIVTSIDGRHGFGGGVLPTDAPVQAAAIGFWKCAAKEWRNHRVRCLDISESVEPDVVARQVAADLAGAVDGDDLEHGLDDEGLWGVELEFSDATPGGVLAPDAVVIAIGGAHGIGADILAGAVAGPGRTIVLAGRTDPEAVAEPDGTEGATTESEMRAALISEARARGDRPVPAEIERALRAALSARRVRSTIARLEAAGATVEYHPLDGRDGDAVASLVESTVGRHGRLDLVLHAAGVLGDAPVARKDAGSIEAVLDTKVIPALALCDAVEEATTVVLFGSVAGRLGNASQSDYGAANEFLAKLAACRRADGADVRCLAWGPWDSGMVSEGMLAAYDAVGIVPIAAVPGVDAFAREIGDLSGAGEVVLANSTEVMARLRWPPTAASILGS